MKRSSSVLFFLTVLFLSTVAVADWQSFELKTSCKTLNANVLNSSGTLLATVGCQRKNINIYDLKAQKIKQVISFEDLQLNYFDELALPLIFSPDDQNVFFIARTSKETSKATAALVHVDLQKNTSHIVGHFFHEWSWDFPRPEKMVTGRLRFALDGRFLLVVGSTSLEETVYRYDLKTQHFDVVARGYIDQFNPIRPYNIPGSSSDIWLMGRELVQLDALGNMQRGSTLPSELSFNGKKIWIYYDSLIYADGETFIYGMQGNCSSASQGFRGCLLKSRFISKSDYKPDSRPDSKQSEGMVLLPAQDILPQQLKLSDLFLSQDSSDALVLYKRPFPQSGFQVMAWDLRTSMLKPGPDLNAIVKNLKAIQVRTYGPRLVATMQVEDPLTREARVLILTYNKLNSF